MLLIASSRNWYSTPWCRPSPEPSSTISMKMPHATLKPVRNERSLFARMVSRISCQVSRSSKRFLPLVLDAAVLEADDAIRHFRDVVLVRDHDDRHAG